MLLCYGGGSETASHVAGAAADEEAGMGKIDTRVTGAELGALRRAALRLELRRHSMFAMESDALEALLIESMARDRDHEILAQLAARVRA
jgi:hypothetical protein